MATVSVILPAYNAERYIDAAVQSICAQTFGDFEFVIINDGSTDRTEAILRDWAARDRRIRLISRPNTGYVRALIEGIAASSAPLIARMDADDLSLPHRFERQVRYLEAHPEVVVLGSWIEFIDQHGRRLHTLRQPSDDAALQQFCMEGTTPIFHPTAMFRRSAYEQVGGYVEQYCPAEDLDLWLKMGEIGQLACVDEVLLRYRLHPDSVSEKGQARQIEVIRRICNEASQRRGTSAPFMADHGWRGTANHGQVEQLLRYGWWAFNSGERSTARSYGLQAVRRRPASQQAWKLLLCSLLKPTPPQGLT